MVAFFSILLAVVLLGITVYGLHRYQTMEVEYTVDRSMPLPPLESDAGPSPDDNASKADGKSPATPLGPDTVSPTTAAKRSKQPTGSAVDVSKKSGHQTWLQRVADLKKSNRLDDALQICRAEFPLWGAYNQACIIERLKLKQAGAGAAREEAFLSRLYQLAAIAELLHDKTGDSDSVPLSQLRQIDQERLEELQFPYQELGYAHLRLIRKSDIKLMLAHWGRPGQHQLPRAYHQDWWEQVI